MGKQAPKKSKESIVKAATQKKAGVKKWTKGKAKEKADHAVFLNKPNYEKLLATIPNIGKHISTSTVVEKFKVVGSVARALLRKCLENGSLKEVEKHSKQTLYAPTAVTLEKAAIAEKEVKKEKGGKVKKDK